MFLSGVNVCQVMLASTVSRITTTAWKTNASMEQSVLMQSMVIHVSVKRDSGKNYLGV